MLSLQWRGRCNIIIILHYTNTQLLPALLLTSARGQQTILIWWTFPNTTNKNLAYRGLLILLESCSHLVIPIHAIDEAYVYNPWRLATTAKDSVFTCSAPTYQQTGCCVCWVMDWGRGVANNDISVCTFVCMYTSSYMCIDNVSAIRRFRVLSMERILIPCMFIFLPQAHTGKIE